jgi:hypothetical protein
MCVLANKFKKSYQNEYEGVDLLAGQNYNVLRKNIFSEPVINGLLYLVRKVSGSSLSIKNQN